MLTKDEIKESLLKVIEGIRNPPPIINFVPLNYTKNRLNNVVDECTDLHREVEALTEAQDTWEHSQRLFAIEAEYKRLRAKLLLMPAVMLIYVGFIAVFFLLRYVDITGFVKDVLQVDAPERLITFGIAGAFLYLATALLSTLSTSENGDAVSKIADFTVRILLAIFVPIILVSLFFTSDGKLADVTLSPELLAFSCGYSAKLVVDILNKIVEKGSKMIDVV